MLKQRRQLFEFLFMGCDLLVVTCAWFVSYWARFQTDFIEADKGIPPFANYLALTLFIWPIWAFVFRRMGLYRAMRGIRRTREIWQIVNANTLSILLFLAVTYLFREKDVQFSRLVFVYFWFFATLFTVVERSVVRSSLREIRRRGYNLRYVLMVGAGRLAGDIASRVRMHPELGMQLVGCLARDESERKGPRGLTVVGQYQDLGKLLATTEVDQVMIALPLEDNHLLPDVMAQIGDSLVDVRVVPDIQQFISLGGAIEEFEGLPVINLQSSPIAGVNLFVKRVLDVLVAFAAIVLTAPLMVLIAFAVKLTSRGPVLFRQERVSVDGSPFTIFKFRTMCSDAERNGPGWTIPKDDRVTGLGRFLRATSLDELPQLFNVVRGDMSLVGPRPERPVFIAEFRRRVPRYMLRHKVPAGITGWAQVNGWRGDTSIDKRIEYDLYYIENWSLMLDLKILFLTAFRGFVNRNAY
jgi:Undecaprenyl-phosphate glucose phosphotransferase